MIENYYKQEEIFSWTYWETSTVIYECFSNNKETVIKEYWWFNYEDIVIYQDIQNKAKKEIDGVYDVRSENLYRYDDKIKKINIQVLHLDQENLTSWCYNKDIKWIDWWLNNAFLWQEFPIIRLPYIEWDTFTDLEPDDMYPFEDYFDKLSKLINYIEKVFEEKTKIPSNQLFSDNIKIIWFDKWVLQIVITDVAWYIDAVVELERRFISPHTVQQ